MEFSGLNPLVKIKFKDADIQALFTQEMAQQGVLCLNANCVSYAIKEPEIQRILKAYKHTLDLIDEASAHGHIKKYLKGSIQGQALRKSA